MVKIDIDHTNATFYEYDDEVELVVDFGTEEILEVISRDDTLIIQTESGRDRVKIPSEVVNGKIQHNNGIVTVTKTK